MIERLALRNMFRVNSYQVNLKLSQRLRKAKPRHQRSLERLALS